MVGLVTKTLKDGAGDEFDGYFYDDGTALYQASVLWDATNSELVDFTAASPVTVDQTTPGTTNGVQVNAALPAGSNTIGAVRPEGRNYETVAASQTDQALGATGAAGDVLDMLLIIPASTSPGAVSIKDGSGSSITVFTGGSSSVSNLVPFPVPIGATSGSGAWKVTTGADVSVIAVGAFT